MRPTKPQVELSQVSFWLQERYGLAGELTELPGEVDRNLLLSASNGFVGIVKIALEEGARESLDAQAAVLERLGESELARLVPRIIPDREGQLTIAVTSDDERACRLRVVSYLIGRPLVEQQHRPPSLHREIGRTLGHLDRALQHFDHPGCHRPFVWDLTRALDLRPLLQAVEPERLALLSSALERVEQRLIPHVDELRTSVIHHDANDHNLLVKPDDDGTPRLCGLIDFGDVLHTPTAAELAIASAYLMLDRPDPWEVAHDVRTGYEDVNPLQPVERELLPELIIARLTVSLLLSADARRRAPEDAYLQVTDRPATDLLDRLLTAGKRAAPARPPEDLLALRRRHLGPNLSLSYRQPLKIIEGRGQYLYDETGRRYLDLVNNVCHVGHCHPRVVAAGQQQMARLNTNTRYLHDHLPEYVRRLTATLPDPLSVCFLVCSGTEANDLALRLARAHTGRREIAVLDHAYHGHSPSLVELSPYKCEGPGGEGLAAHVTKLDCPDAYRGRHRDDAARTAYAEDARVELERLSATGRPVGALLAESLLGCGGQIVPPDGYLETVHRATRAAGGVCLADEVQVGFGRVGTHMWAFEAQGVVPDVVTLGKPIGNGHPLAAVVTTPDIAASFDTGMEYFNTFGGNPVSCAIGLAVLDVIEDERLQGRALQLGERFLAGFTELATRHEAIGDVRGRGLFLGLELVRDRAQRSPDAALASEVVEAMKERGFLLSTDGPEHDVIKIKPPMVLTEGDVDDTLQALDEVLGQLR